MPPKADDYFHDPEGERFGIPTWPWGQAPRTLATYRMLSAQELRPNGQQVVAQLGWFRRDEEMFAGMYRIDLAAPKRPMTIAKWGAVHKALRARRICPECGQERDYQISRRFGACNPCTWPDLYAQAA